MSDHKKNNTEIFWVNLLKDNNWYLIYLPQDFDEVKLNAKELAPLIAKETNKLRYKINFKQEDYWRIMKWDSIVIDIKLDHLLTQFCSNCKE